MYLLWNALAGALTEASLLLRAEIEHRKISLPTITKYRTCTARTGSHLLRERTPKTRNRCRVPDERVTRPRPSGLAVFSRHVRRDARCPRGLSSSARENYQKTPGVLPGIHSQNHAVGFLKKAFSVILSKGNEIDARDSVWGRPTARPIFAQHTFDIRASVHGSRMLLAA